MLYGEGLELEDFYTDVTSFFSIIFKVKFMIAAEWIVVNKTIFPVDTAAASNIICGSFIKPQYNSGIKCE